MNILIIIGIVLGGGTIITDRFIKPLPNGLVIVLYIIAVILIIAGMIVNKHTQVTGRQIPVCRDVDKSGFVEIKK